MESIGGHAVAEIRDEGNTLVAGENIVGMLRSMFLLGMASSLLAGCSSYQPTKNVWKTTKGLWYTYVSPASSIDYGEKGSLSAQALALTHSMMGIDVELSRLERAMLNADRPPTRDWLTSFLTDFPWINGFAGVKYDGTILGQEPATPLKILDYIPLLYEDKKQNSRALRADVQNTALGPEVLIAAPLYDGVDFLGIVAANFDMRSLMQYSRTPQDVVILTPYALLWPGKYDFAATPLAGVDWEQAAVKSTSGTCTNATGTFAYMVRYFANIPLIFAVAESGTFPEGNGDVAQGLAFFPKERPKLPPPPHEARKPRPNFAQGLAEEPPAPEQTTAAQAGSDGAGTPAGAQGSADIQPGSRDSMLLRRKQAERRSRVRERSLPASRREIDMLAHDLAREDVPLPPPTGLGIDTQTQAPTLPGGRPSPFGPQAGKDNVPTLPGGRPSPFGPRSDAASDGATAPAAPAAVPEAKPAAAEGTSASSSQSEPQQKEDAATRPKAMPPQESANPPQLPGGRPSPFGPRN